MPKLNTDLTFDLINTGSQNRNELHILGSDFGKKDNNVVLKVNMVEGVKQFKLHGNSNAITKDNYSLALIFQPDTLNLSLLDQIKIVGIADKTWSLKADILDDNGVQKPVFYLLVNAPIFNPDLEIPIINLRVPDRLSSAGNMELRFSATLRNSHPDQDKGIFYTSNFLNITNLKGLPEPPFKAFIENRFLMTAGPHDFTIRLVNYHNSTLDLSNMLLQVSFYIFEDKLKSPDSLMELGNFNSNDFTVDLTSKIPKIPAVKEATKEATQFLGILSIDIKGQSFALGQFEELALNLRQLTPYFDGNKTGLSNIKIRYFNIKDYRDGELDVEIFRQQTT